MKKTQKLLVGAHITIAAGYDQAISIAEDLGCSTLQIFTKSNRSWFGKKIDPQEIEKFYTALKNSSIKEVFVHCGYLVNLASKNEDIRKKSVQSLTEELMRCEELKIKYLVLHPGSHLGAGEQEGIQKIAFGLDEALSATQGNVMVLLETAAGQGSAVGATFESLKAIEDACTNKKNIGFCLDTCHIFAAGYDLRSKEVYEKTMNSFKKHIGLYKLKLIHLNDSKDVLGQKKDRHEFIGKGRIGKEGFRLILHDADLKKISKILETPVEKMEDYKKDLMTLEELAKEE